MQFSYRFPAVRGLQANREYYVSMVPLKVLSKIFVTDDSEVVSPEFRAQRRLNETRIPTIKNYILNNLDTYVFSALSASLDGRFKFIPFENNSNIGILEIDMDTNFLINDGQHRKAAIEEALKEEPSLGDETISVVFFEDKGLERSQQMFTDLNKHAVKTSNSISTLYDSRDLVAVMTKQIITEIPFFSQYTDKEKDNLGKNSSKLFTLNNMYKANKRVIGTVEEYDDDFDFLLSYWNAIVNNIVEWQELIRKDIYKSDLRQNYILCLNVTISAFGRLGAYFYQNREVNFCEVLLKLRQINWLRNNLDDWGGRVIGENGKILGSETSVILICNKLKMFLDIPLDDHENKKEKEVHI